MEKPKIRLSCESLTDTDRVIAMQTAAQLMPGLGLGDPDRNPAFAEALTMAFGNGVAYDRCLTPELRKQLDEMYAPLIREMKRERERESRHSNRGKQFIEEA